MIIATDDPALAVQLHLRVGAVVQSEITVEDIAEFEIGWDMWLIDPIELADTSWKALALRSRGAIEASPDEAAHTVLQRAQAASATARQIHEANPTYIGDLHPHVILVGERPNPAARLPLMTFQPGATGCGDFLFTALQPLLGLGYRVGLMNAYIGNKPQDLPLKVPRYVALGSVADKYLTEREIEHSRVDHPQYARRFHYSQQMKYAAHLVAATISDGEYEGIIR